MTLKRSLMIFLALFVVAALMASPAWAAPREDTTKKCNDDRDNDGDGKIDDEDSDCEGVGGGGSPANPLFMPTHVGAVGHDLGCLVCENPECALISDPKDPPVKSDFFDVGTKHVGGESVCELLQCAVYMGGTVACGHNSDFTDEPRPRVDISGLFDLWDQDPQSQGEPAACFGNGIVDPNVQVQAGSAGEVNVVLFFQDEVDGTSPTLLSARCDGATTLVSYEARIGPCSLIGDLPPGPGESTVITCWEGIEASIRNQGGGGTGRKCACRASGLLRADTVITFRGLPVL